MSGSLTSPTAVGSVHAAPPTAMGSPSAFQAVTPCRLLDTRADRGALEPASTIEIQVTGRCGIEAQASAAAVTLTVTDTAADGFLTAWPHGDERPIASNLNFTSGQIRANGAILRLGNDGVLSVFTSAATHLVVDVTGEFTPTDTTTSGRFVAVAQRRIVDTRATGRPPAGAEITVRLPDEVPTDAVAVAVNLTTSDSRGAGFFTAYPGGIDRPTASVLNVDGPHETRAASSVVPVTAGSFRVFTSSGEHVIVDLAGYFTGPSAPRSSDGLLLATTPTRLLDTRPEHATLHAGGAVEIAVPPGAASVVVNLTMTETIAPGWLKASPSRTTVGEISTVNADRASQTVANLAIVAASEHGIAVATYATTDVVADLFGWFTGNPVAGSGDAPINPPGAAGGCLVGSTSPIPTTVDPQQRWQLGNVSNDWWSALAPDRGPRGAVVIVGDSLTQGSINQTMAALLAAGFGPICIDGGVARFVTYTSARLHVSTGVDVIARIRASDSTWAADDTAYVAAFGTNDVGFPNPTWYATQIDTLRAATGAHPLWWVNVRTRVESMQPWETAWNHALSARGDLAVIDWSAAVAPNPNAYILGSDLTHLTLAGSHLRATLITDALDAPHP